MTTTPTPQPAPTPVRRSRAKMLAAFWVILIVADVARGVFSGSLLSLGAASSLFLALGGLLLALSLRRQERHLPHEAAGQAGFVAVLLAAAAMLADIFW